MAKVQQCAIALLGLVAGHDIGLHLNRPGYRRHPPGLIRAEQGSGGRGLLIRRKK